MATVECSVRPLLDLALVLICPGSSSIQGRRKRSQYCRFLSSVNSIGRFSYGGEEGISGVERLTNGDGEEELKRQSIDKVDDLLAMLEREGGDSPTSPEDEIDGGLSIDEVLARARERGDGEECGLEEEDSGDSSEEEDIVTEFPISNGGNSSLAEVFLSILIECLFSDA